MVRNLSPYICWSSGFPQNISHNYSKSIMSTKKFKLGIYQILKITIFKVHFIIRCTVSLTVDSLKTCAFCAGFTIISFFNLKIHKQLLTKNKKCAIEICNQSENTSQVNNFFIPLLINFQRNSKIKMKSYFCGSESSSNSILWKRYFNLIFLSLRKTDEDF